jgi:hypothetical protein
MASTRKSLAVMPTERQRWIGDSWRQTLTSRSQLGSASRAKGGTRSGSIRLVRHLQRHRRAGDAVALPERP